MTSPSSSSAYLDVTQGPLQGQSLPLVGPETVVGRDPDCQLALTTYREVSRRHARFYLQRGVWCVEDLGSTNGTFVNNVRATPSFSLDNGTLIQMGDFHARFRTLGLPVQPSGSQPTQYSPTAPTPPPQQPVAPIPMPVVPVVPVQPYPVIYPPEPPKQVALALIFSLLLPGGGQFYNGDTSKGATMLAAFLVSGVFSLFTCGLTGLASLAIWIFSIIDAVQGAERINRASGWQRPY